MTRHGASAYVDEEASLYVIEFDQGTIKVGISARPGDRMRELANIAEKFGITVLRHWASEPHMGAFLNERTLLRWCTTHAKEDRRGEWFGGLDFEAVKAAISSIIRSDGLPPTDL